METSFTIAFKIDLSSMSADEPLCEVGGHCFAHLSSRDLVHWEEHPLAVPLDDWWTTIGTGTPFGRKATGTDPECAPPPPADRWRRGRGEAVSRPPFGPTADWSPPPLCGAPGGRALPDRTPPGRSQWDHRRFR